jgi:hypothetical protein
MIYPDAETIKSRREKAALLRIGGHTVNYFTNPPDALPFVLINSRGYWPEILDKPIDELMDKFPCREM